MTPWARLATASTVSNVGDGMALAALPLLAASLSEDAGAVAAVTAATAPWLLFGLSAGALLDAVDRRRAAVVADLARAGLVGGLAMAVAAGEASLGLVYAAVFLLGTCETVADTAAQTLVPAVVAPERLEAANGRLFGLQLAANGFVGPPLGGAAFALAAAAPFATDAASFAAGAALLAGLPRRPAVPDTPRPAERRRVREGLGFVWSHPSIRAFAVGAAAINLAHTAGAAVLVVLAEDRLGLGPGGFGALLGAGAVGSVAGAVVAAGAVRRAGRRWTVVAAVGAFAAGLLAVGLARHAVLAGAGLAVMGAASEVWNVVAVAHRQAATPDHLLGRVMSAYRVIAYGTLPVGAALGGVLADGLGVRAPFVAGAAATAALGAWLAARLRALDA